jgi:hypothetical protein
MAVTKGLLNINIPSLDIFLGNYAEGNLKLQVLGLRTDNDIILPGSALNSPMNIVIPQVSNLDLKVIIDLLQTGVNISNVSLVSSLGSFVGNAEIGLDQFKRPQSIVGAFDVELTDRGSQVAGRWLPLVSQGKVSEQAHKFKVNINGPFKRPQVLFSNGGIG